MHTERAWQATNKKPKLTGGHKVRIRCSSKAWGGGASCDCGQYGKKSIRFPKYWRNWSNFNGWKDKYEAKCRKWKKHEQIRRIQKFKERMGIGLTAG